MIRVCASASTGRLLWIQRDGVHQMPIERPESEMVEVIFDEETNPELAEHLCAHGCEYNVVGGTLALGGETVAIAADGENEANRKAVAAGAAKLRTYLGTPRASRTAALREDALEIVIKGLLYLARRMEG